MRLSSLGDGRYTYDCPHCGYRLTLSEDELTTTDRCWGCNLPISIPNESNAIGPNAEERHRLFEEAVEIRKRFNAIQRTAPANEKERLERRYKEIDRLLGMPQFEIASSANLLSPKPYPNVHVSPHNVRDSTSLGERVECPYCGERILATARKCCFCDEWLDDIAKKQEEKFLIREAAEVEDRDSKARNNPRATDLQKALGIVLIMCIVTAWSWHETSKYDRPSPKEQTRQTRETSKYDRPNRKQQTRQTGMDPVSAVKYTVRSQTDRMGTFRSAPLKGGVAVLSSRSWAYWVKDNQVYAANGLAHAFSPTIPLSPEDVRFTQIEAAINANTSSPTRMVVPANPWFSGGTLHRATAAQWRVASYENKLATAADWLSGTLWKGHLDIPSDFDRLKVKAQMLVSAVDEVINANPSDPATPTEIASLVIIMANDLGP